MEEDLKISIDKIRKEKEKMLKKYKRYRYIVRRNI